MSGDSYCTTYDGQESTGMLALAHRCFGSQSTVKVGARNKTHSHISKIRPWTNCYHTSITKLT